MFFFTLYLVFAALAHRHAETARYTPPPAFDARAETGQLETTPDAPCFIIETDDGVTETCP